jgi:membrane protease YdiL (CAAX protease family)
MNKKQKIAIVTPLVLVAIMYPVFQLTVKIFGYQIGWYIGLILYWLIWGLAFPLWIIGKESIRKLIQPQKIDKKVFLLVIFPLLIALIARFFIGMGYEKESIWILLLLLSTAFGNGFFEEVLWRGVYMKLFTGNIFYRMIWPSFWFAIWHYAPGSVSSNSNIVALMIGAGLFGLYLSYIAKKTNTVWWSIITHTLSGIIMIL